MIIYRLVDIAFVKGTMKLVPKALGFVHRIFNSALRNFLFKGAY